MRYLVDALLIAQERGGVTTRALMDEFDLSKQTARCMIVRIAERGLLAPGAPIDGRVAYAITPAGVAYLREQRQTTRIAGCDATPLIAAMAGWSVAA